MKLKNGAAVISRSKTRDLGFVVLAQWRKNNGQMEYITWIAGVEKDGSLNCYWGHYFTDLEKATRDYKDRVIQFC